MPAVVHQCSLAGIFLTHVSSTFNVGRRTQTVRYPFNDSVDFIDFGRSPISFEDELLILGEDADEKASTLAASLESPGPYEYVHPVFGPKMVQIEGDQEGGTRFHKSSDGPHKYTISLRMIVVDEDDQFERFDNSNQIPNYAADAIRSTDADFIASYSEDGLTFDDLVNNTINKVRGVEAFVAKINQKIAKPLGMIDQLTSAVNGITRQLETLKATPGTIATKVRALIKAGMNLAKIATESNPALSPVETVRSAARRREEQAGAIRNGAISVAGGIVVGPVSGTSSSADTADSAKTATILSPSSPSNVMTAALEEAGDFDLDVSSIPVGPDATPQRAQELSNAKALIRLVKTASLIAYCETVTSVAWGSFEQTREAIESIKANTDAIINDPDTNDEVFQRMITLRATTIEYMRNVAQTLPRIRTVKINRMLPAELIAHSLWGDYTLVDRIFDRNVIEHPGRIGPYATIEVLGDYS